MTDKRTDPDTAAAELAAGLLAGDDLRDAMKREGADPEFAREVARWRARLAPLLDEGEPVAVPDAVWARVEQSLGAAGQNNVVALRRKVTVWRGLTGAMTALAASLALVIVSRQATPPPPPPIAAPNGQPMVAMIKAGAEVAAVANWDSNSRSLLVSEVRMPVVASRDYQLWLIPADGKPHSVGVMPNRPHMRVALAPPMSAMLAEGATLAVSLEPQGGAPGDAPSGPVVASGPLSAA